MENRQLKRLTRARLNRARKSAGVFSPEELLIGAMERDLNLSKLIGGGGSFSSWSEQQRRSRSQMCHARAIWQVSAEIPLMKPD